MKKNWLIILFLNCFISAIAQPVNKLGKYEKDFEKFWSTFKNNYPFFELKKVNWDSTYVHFRPQVNRYTNQNQFIEVIKKMVDPLKDGHITISKGENVIYKSPKPSIFKQEFKGLEQEYKQLVDTTLIKYNLNKPKGVGPVFKNEHLYYYSQSNEVGYIRITRCFGNVESLFDDKKEIQDTQLMLQLFDSLLTDVSISKALIIDIRTNGGGHGGLELASRFVNETTLTHYKSLKLKGSYTNFSPLSAQYISPNKGLRYLKPLYILTSDKTASSAEDFTVSLYKQKQVTTIGTNTAGMLSDMMSEELSGDLAFTLSNQVYYTAEKELLEDKGIPVKIFIPNTKKDLQENVDPVLQRVFQLIQLNTNGN